VSEQRAARAVENISGEEEFVARPGSATAKVNRRLLGVVFEQTKCRHPGGIVGTARCVNTPSIGSDSAPTNAKLAVAVIARTVVMRFLPQQNKTAWIGDVSQDRRHSAGIQHSAGRL
jgi:hypothetical protein